MKKSVLGLCLLLFLSGCQRVPQELQRVMTLREQLLKSSTCSFLCDITADYGDSIHKFSVDCQGDSKGNITFTVTAPQNIAGITGRIHETGGQLTFAETALQFPLLADQQLSPVSGPWIFLRTLRSGYLANAGMEADQLRIGARDSYEEDALLVDLWLGAGDLPERAEVLYRNRKILTLEIRDFSMQPGI